MTPGTSVIVNMLGGVALLLWGVRMVRTGILRAWGERLRFFVEHRLRSRLSGFAAGAAATTILGSGTATSMIVSNIAVTGALPTALGLAVLLGADTGSAIITSIFASGLSLALWTSPILLAIGYVVFNWSDETKPHNTGRILIGLGLLLLSLRLISAATQPLNTASLFHDVLSALGHEPVLGFIVGALLAWAFHSTLAAILLIGSLLTNGSLQAEGALYFLLGINLGGCLPAAISALALPVGARRIPMANLLCRGLFSIIVLGFVGPISHFLNGLQLSELHKALSFHFGFNLATGLIFLPLTKLVENLVVWMIPDGQSEDSLARPRYLDPLSLSSPPVALANATLETARMTEILERMFTTALEAIAANSKTTLKAIDELDERLNLFQSAVQTYLADLAQMAPLSKDESRRALETTLYVSNLEHAGDVIQLNLVNRINVKIQEGLTFTPAEQNSLDSLSSLIAANIKRAAAVLTARDVDGAKALIEQKDQFRALEQSVIDEHFRKGAGNKKEALRRSALFVDMIRDLHRINSHIVSAGYPIVDEAGLLRETRLRKTNSEKR
ncbi:MAG: Na/Pi cotransporter family protein [Alphaproteobacteria bacterium]|nr:Na/Pi cotransporter family protein [Alphaproteobacteria bacterium]